MKDHQDIDLQSPSYTPLRLMSKTAELLGAYNWAALARILEVHPAVITRANKRQELISANIFVQIMDRTGWSIQRVRDLAGMPYEGPPPPIAPIPVAEKPRRTPRKRIPTKVIQAIQLDNRPRKQIAFDYNITPQHVGAIQRRNEVNKP